MEAERKLKDLAANETIARGQLRGGRRRRRGGAEAGRRRTRAGPGQAAGEETGDPRAAGSRRRRPADRPTREAAPMRARLEADPTNAAPVSAAGRRLPPADEFEQARAMLQEGLAATGNAFELTVETGRPGDRAVPPQPGPDRGEAQDRARRRGAAQARASALRKEINTRELDLYRQKADRFPTEMSHRYELGIRLLRGGQMDEAIRELQHGPHRPARSAGSR